MGACCSAPTTHDGYPSQAAAAPHKPGAYQPPVVAGYPAGGGGPYGAKSGPLPQHHSMPYMAPPYPAAHGSGYLAPAHSGYMPHAYSAPTGGYPAGPYPPAPGPAPYGYPPPVGALPPQHHQGYPPRRFGGGGMGGMGGMGTGMALGAGAGLLGGLLIADAMTPDCGGACDGGGMDMGGF